MIEKITHGRRSFLKKAVATTGVTGNILAVAEPVAAASQSLTVDGNSDGEYSIRVNDSNAYGGSDLDADDTVENYSGYSWFEGTVTDGDTDTLNFDGQITSMTLYGSIRVKVDNPNGMNLGDELTVNGTNCGYSVRVTGDIDQKSKCESNDNISSDGVTANGSLDGSDEDIYQTNGTIEYAGVADCGYVTFNHQL